MRPRTTTPKDPGERRRRESDRFDVVERGALWAIVRGRGRRATDCVIVLHDREVARRIAAALNKDTRDRQQ